MVKPCSHVVCKVCTDSLIRPAKQCIVCDKILNDHDIIELKREGAWPLFLLLCFVNPDTLTGTGFAGGGMAETTRRGLAFQG